MKTIVKRSERRFLVSALALAGGLSTGLHAQDAFQGELVGEGTVSSDRGDTFPALSPDGTVLYFSRVKEGSGWSDQELLRSAWEDGAWSDPEVLPFSGGSASDRIQSWISWSPLESTRVEPRWGMRPLPSLAIR